MIVAQEKPNYAYSDPPVYETPLQAEVRPQSERRARLVLTALILSAFVLGVAYILFNAHLTNVGYRLENLKHQVATIDAENQSLEMLISRQDTLVRIESLAITKLGMVAPGDDHTLTVAIADPSLKKQQGDAAAVAAVAAVGKDDRSVVDEVAEAPEPSLLEALFSFISQREPPAEPA